MEREEFVIESLDWKGKFGKPEDVKEEMKKLGKKIAKCHVYGYSNPDPYKKEKKKLKALNDELFTPRDFKKDGIVVATKGEISLRLDLQNIIKGTDLAFEGLTGKFARYEIQINGANLGGEKTSIACVCIPYGVVLKGNVVVDAFVQSMNFQIMAVIRKRDK